MLRRIFLLLPLAFCLALPARVAIAAEGSSGFCLYELPDDGSGKRRYVNLSILQYVELSKDEFKIVYGGGSFGAGYESKVPIKNADEGKALMEQLDKTIRACRN